MGEYDCNGSSWESSMSSRQKAARRRMSGQYGKGDKRRTESGKVQARYASYRTC